MKANKQSGFTLIELSIVLVIIGLIVGGVLVGQTLIEAAEMRKTISISRDFATSIHTFRTKYNCLPGDCRISPFFPTATDGDANRRIDASGEFDNLDAHLRLAELLPDGVEEITPGSGFTITKGLLKTNSGLTASLDNGCSYSAESTWADSMTGYTLAFGFTPAGGVKLAPFINMDNKYDDGNPTSGQFRVSDSFPVHPDACVSIDNYNAIGVYEGFGSCKVCINTAI